MLFNAEPWHYLLTLLSSYSTFAHNRLHLTPCLEKDSLHHQVITTDWDSSTTDSRVAPQTTLRHAFIKKNIIIGFTLER